ncbi:MAG: tetratricopeptide repeat protein [Proteobacteria bacterium]|nr:tetratricopeptide repeat protein [Pseudomonadota bacterium]
MQRISLPAAITLTEWSERTFWRRFSDGSLVRETVNGKTLIDFDTLRPHLRLPMGQEELRVLEAAEGGVADAQNEMALILLQGGRPKGAIYWLELAARQGHADATCLLGLCHLNGEGTPRDENIGIMWLASAAARGHAIACRLMGGLHQGGLGQPSATG